MFKVLTDLEFSGLVDHIKRNGLMEKGKLFQGCVLDGRHRAKACEKLGQEMEWEQFEGTPQEALEYVLGKNLHHRHMEPNDRNKILIEVATTYEREKWSDKAATLKGAPGSTPTHNEMAKATGVSKVTARRARKIVQSGTPKLQAMVKDGKVGIKAAAAVAALPKAKQKQLVAQGPKALTEAVREDVRDYSNAYNSKPAAPLIQTRAGLAKDSTMSTLAEKLVPAETMLKDSARKKLDAEYYVAKIEACYDRLKNKFEGYTSRMIIDAIIKAVRA